MVTAKAEVFRKAALNLQKAQVEQTKAKTTQLYIKMGVLNPLDIRKQLVKDNYWFSQAQS